jgi:tetratricopeptide (TPR) repeat protein
MADNIGPSLTDGLPFQLRAAANFLNDLHPQTKVVSHLREIVRVAYCALQSRNTGLLWAPLLAFAYWLENELRLDESMDVLDTTLRLREGDQGDHVAAHLQRGRVLRSAGRFLEARHAYNEGGRLARGIGDLRSEMISRIGSAWVTLKAGDIPAAEGELRDVLAQSRTTGDVFVEARAQHDLAAVLFYAGRTAQAIPLAYKAFELYEEPAQRARALNDVGVFLKEMGHYAGAKQAFVAVIQGEPPAELRVKTELELVALSAAVQDRVGFERWRRPLDAASDRLPPEERIELDIKVGTGLLMFGHTEEGINRLRRAQVSAEQFKFGQRIFEIEQLMFEIREGTGIASAQSLQSDASTETPEFQQVIEDLHALGAGA